MAVSAFAYPAVLTKKAWDKNKGVMAKLAVGKTDVGAALAALEDSVTRAGLLAVKPFAGTDPGEFLLWEKGLMDGLTKGASVAASKAGAAKIVAKAALADFEKSKTVPKSSTAYVKSIVTALDAFGGQLATYLQALGPDIRSEFRDRMKKTSSYAAITDAAKTAEATYAKLNAMIKRVEAQPTVAMVQTVFSGDGAHRQLTTTFKLWDQLVAKPWPTLCKTIYAGQAMSQYFPLPGLADIANENSGTASKKLDAAVKSGKNEARVVTTFMLAYSSSVIKGKDVLDYIKAANKVITAI